MKSYELPATDENIRMTFLNDTIDRNKDIKSFITILNSIEDCCTIAVDSYWGSGKTFFVKQVKMILDANNNFVDSPYLQERDQILNTWNKYNKNNSDELKPHVTVYYDAWENDSDDDPILSIVFQILQSVDTEYSFNEEGKLKNLLNIVGDIAESVSKVKVKSIVDNLQELKGDNLFNTLRNKKGLKDKIDDFLNSLLPEHDERLVVFIDELDRCKPSYAVKLLERIKHYFNNNLVTFVFSVNINELQHTIKQYYGNEFNACKYLDRFFDIRITLPKPNMDKFYQSIDFYNSQNYSDLVANRVIEVYNFQLREISRYIPLIKIAVPTHDKLKHIYGVFDAQTIKYVINVFIPIIIGLKIADSNKYRNFVEGKDYSPLLEIFDKSDTFTYLYSQLLSKGETYGEATTKLTHVKLSEKLKELYNAIFVTNFEEIPLGVTIGQLTFNARTREVLLRTESLLSENSNFDI